MIYLMITSMTLALVGMTVLNYRLFKEQDRLAERVALLHAVFKLENEIVDTLIDSIQKNADDIKELKYENK